jgi:pentatricopeptide repeat protein
MEEEKPIETSKYTPYRLPSYSASFEPQERSVSDLYGQLSTLTRSLNEKEAEKCFEELIGRVGQRQFSWTAQATLMNVSGDETSEESSYNDSSSISTTQFSTQSDSGVKREEIHLDPIVPYNMMLTMYSRTKDADKFFAILNTIGESGIQPDIYTYNTLFKLRANRGELEELLTLATEMIESNVKLDVVSYNILIEALGEKGWSPVPIIGPFGGFSGISSANRVLEMMSRLKIRREPRTYELIINAMFRLDLCEEVLELWDEMLLRGTLPTAELCSTVMKAYYRLGRPSEALTIWNRVQPILLDYINHLEGRDEVRTTARPRRLRSGSASWDPILPTSRTENILLDIMVESGDVLAVFQVWQLFRRADITPLANSCAALMEVYLDLGDYASGLNVFEWMGHVGITPSPRALAARIALLAHHNEAQNAIHSRDPAYSPNSVLNSFPTTQRMYTLDQVTTTRIRAVWKSIRTLDPDFHSPQMATFEAAFIAFFSNQDFDEVIQVFKQLDTTIRSRHIPDTSPEPLSSETETTSTDSQSKIEEKSKAAGPRKVAPNDRDGTWKPKVRVQRHKPPLRGRLEISFLVLVLEACRLSSMSFAERMEIVNAVEELRSFLDLTPSQEYVALFKNCLEKIDSMPINRAAADSKWQMTVGGPDMLKQVAKSQPKFVPNSWNIAIPSPKVLLNEDDEYN